MTADSMLNRLVGNAALKSELSAAMAAGHLPHSLLFVGEAGCGAGFAARCLAADYLFPQGGQAAEDVAADCLSRVLVSESSPPHGYVETGKVREALSLRDVGKSGQISVHQIRCVRTEIFKSSLSTEGRVVLVYGAQNMSVPAANAFLKVLEEPPEGALFLLTANSLAGVLPTIRSRCAAYTLSPVPAAECAAAVRAVMPGVTAPEAAYLAAVFAGRIGACLNVAPKGPRRQIFEAAERLYGAICTGNEYAVLAQLVPFEKEKSSARLLLGDLSALCAATLRDAAFHAGQGSPAMAQRRAAVVISAAGETQKLLDSNVNQKLALTLFGAKAAEG